MENTIKPLPENERLLELLLEQANRVIDYIEPIIRVQRYRADQLRIASSDLRAIAPRLAVLQSLKNGLDKHTALDGPDYNFLKEYLESEPMERFLRLQKTAIHRLTALARAQSMTQENFGQAGEALAQIADAQSGALELFKSLRRQIIGKLSDLARTKTSADKSPDKPGKKSAGQRVRLPRNDDVLRLAKELQRNERQGLPKTQVALEFTNGDRTKAETLLRELRRYPDLIAPAVVD